jgi:SRSO17 transposase
MAAPILSSQQAGRWSAVTPAELQRVRTRLVAFAEGMFESMPRADQRRRGEMDLRGLLLDGKRKSIQPMAERLTAAGDVEVADLEQALQQFVNQSPWDPTLVRERLARRMIAELRPDAWVVDDTAFPKFGRWSVGSSRSTAGRWASRPTARSG